MFHYEIIAYCYDLQDNQETLVDKLLQEICHLKKS
jgi:hypothetical protein